MPEIGFRHDTQPHDVVIYQRYCQIGVSGLCTFNQFLNIYDFEHLMMNFHNLLSKNEAMQG